MILSGSGNQGITASVPVVRYARHLGADQETSQMVPLIIATALTMVCAMAS